MKQAATRIEDKEYEIFQRTAANIGTTTSDALRMFIYAFNDHHGFPYPVRSHRMQIGAFETEDEAADFAPDLAMEKMTVFSDDMMEEERKIRAFRNLDAARNEISQYLPDDFDPEKELEEARAERYASIG